MEAGPQAERTLEASLKDWNPMVLRDEGSGRASNPRLGSVLSVMTRAVGVGFQLGSSIRIDFHKDHLDREVRG